MFLTDKLRSVRNAMSIIVHSTADAIIKGRPFFCLVMNSSRVQPSRYSIRI